MLVAPLEYILFAFLPIAQAGMFCEALKKLETTPAVDAGH